MIEVTREDGVAVLRMDDGAMNAFALEDLRQLTATLHGLAEDHEPVVITGNGRAFSAGVDLPRLLAEDAEYGYAYIDALDRAFRALFAFPRPTVAAVDGHAIAGGFVLACCCDRRLAADGDAQLGLTELSVGVPFPPSAMEVVRHVTPAGARRLILEAELHDVAAIRDLGAIDEIVPAPELLARARELAARLGAVPASTYALTKQQLQYPVLERIEAEQNRTGDAVSEAWNSREIRERIERFVEDRIGRGTGGD